MRQVSKSLVVIVDADAIVAQAFPKDSNHERAMEISNRLNALEARVIYPVTAILEAVTVLQARLNSGATAYGVAEVFSNPEIQASEVNQKTYIKALSYFNVSTSKKNTMFDCVIMAIAKENNATAIFSFDKLYRKRGFKLASEL